MPLRARIKLNTVWAAKDPPTRIFAPLRVFAIFARNQVLTKEDFGQSRKEPRRRKETRNKVIDQTRNAT
jgi:hypothetical protein